MIIGLCGQAGAGKDTVADFLVKNHGFVKVALGDPLKRICKDVFDFSDEQLWGSSSERNKPDMRYVRKRSGSLGSQQCWTEAGYETRPLPEADEYLTPRFALQQLGTEWGRSCHPNVWIDYALRVVDKLLHKSGILRGVHYHYDQMYGLCVLNVPFELKPAGVVISDVRFINEVDAIRKAGGHVWKIERPGAGLTGAAAQHASEQEQNSVDPRKFASTLNNADGPLEELETLVGKELGALRFIYPDQK